MDFAGFLFSGLDFLLVIRGPRRQMYYRQCWIEHVYYNVGSHCVRRNGYYNGDFVSIVVTRLMIFWNTVCIHKIPNYNGSTCKSVYCDAKKCLNFLLYILALLMNLSSF